MRPQFSALKNSFTRKQNRALKKKYFTKIISYIIKTNKFNFIGKHTRLIEQNLTKQWAFKTEQPGTSLVSRNLHWINFYMVYVRLKPMIHYGVGSLRLQQFGFNKNQSRTFVLQHCLKNSQWYVFTITTLNVSIKYKKILRKQRALNTATVKLCKMDNSLIRVNFPQLPRSLYLDT